MWQLSVVPMSTLVLPFAALSALWSVCCNEYHNINSTVYRVLLMCANRAPAADVSSDSYEASAQYVWSWAAESGDGSSVPTIGSTSELSMAMLLETSVAALVSLLQSSGDVVAGKNVMVICLH